VRAGDHIARALMGLAAALGGAVAALGWAWGALVLVVVMGAGAAIMAPAALLTMLLMARSVTDVGLSAEAPLLPAAALNGSIAVLIILIAALYCWGPSARGVLLTTTTVLIALLFWSTIYWLHYGTLVEPLSEVVRFLSVILMFWLARHLLANLPEQRSAWLLLAAATPAAVSILLGALGVVPFFVSPDQRAVGTFSHPNAAAAFLAVAALLALCTALESKSRLAAGMFLLQLAALMATQSLGAIAGVSACSVLVILLVRRLEPAQRILLLFAGGLIFVVIAVAAGATVRLEEFESACRETVAGTCASTNSFDWRLLNWSLLLDEWRQQWLLGHGLASTATHIQPSRNLPHSVPVQLLVETGVVGLSLTIIAIALLIRSLLGLRRRSTLSSTAALCALAAVIIHSSESNMLGYTPALYLLAAVIGSAWRFDTAPAADVDSSVWNVSRRHTR
jgi:O-antigen ligase